VARKGENHTVKTEKSAPDKKRQRKHTNRQRRETAGPREPRKICQNPQRRKKRAQKKGGKRSVTIKRQRGPYEHKQIQKWGNSPTKNEPPLYKKVTRLQIVHKRGTKKRKPNQERPSTRMKKKLETNRGEKRKKKNTKRATPRLTGNEKNHKKNNN